MNTKDVLGVISLFLAMLIVIGCSNESSESPSKTQVKNHSDHQPVRDVSLNTLMQPTNAFAVSSIPAITSKNRALPIQFEALGYTSYNTSTIGAISARVSGRIEKLYVKYRYQLVKKGQKIMDVYSPELVTAQQNLIFVLTNDESNTSLLNAAKQKLILLGFQGQQLEQVIKTHKAIATVSVYSLYSGHIHDALNMENADSEVPAMNEPSALNTQELTIKEGMYLDKGQTIFKVYNATNVWALLNIYPSDQSFIEVGNKVRIVAEAKPEIEISSSINFIEPFFRTGSKTLTARANFDNSVLKLPVGSQLKAIIFSKPVLAQWLPIDAILTLGLNKIVFVRSGKGYKAREVVTGISYKNEMQIIKGLALTDSVAANAQYLMDSESFIRVER